MASQKQNRRPTSRKDDDKIAKNNYRAEQKELRFITKMDKTFRQYGSYNKPSLSSRARSGARGMLGIFGNRVTEN